MFGLLCYRAHPSEGGLSLNVVQQPWFVVLMCVLVLAVVFGSIAWIYVRRRNGLTKDIGHLSGTYLLFPTQKHYQLLL